MDDILSKVLKFKDDRDWKQFHNPKDLAISISLEANELLECFQWKSENEITQLMNSDEKVKIEDEVADISMYLLSFCDIANINLKDAIAAKIEKITKSTHLKNVGESMQSIIYYRLITKLFFM